MNLIPVKNFPVDYPPGLPTQGTIYKWRSMKKYPRLTVKIAGKVFFDLSEWNKMAENCKKEQETESKQIWG